MWQANLTTGATLKTANYNYLHTDHLGTVQLATDSTGQVTWKAVAEAFGKTILNPTNKITMNLRFPGQYYDQETELHYNYFRDYDPSLGRYNESDPIGLDGGINSFAYVNGNPLVKSDNYGLKGKGGVVWSDLNRDNNIDLNIKNGKSDYVVDKIMRSNKGKGSKGDPFPMEICSQKGLSLDECNTLCDIRLPILTIFNAGQIVEEGTQCKSLCIGWCGEGMCNGPIVMPGSVEKILEALKNRK